MGNSTQQWRGSIGAYAGRIASTRWTNTSGEKTKRKRSFGREERSRGEAWRRTRAESVASMIYLLLTVSMVMAEVATTTCYTCLPATMLTLPWTGSSAGANNCIMSSPGTSGLNETFGQGARQIDLLLLSGDVETNPGPLAPLARGPNLEKVSPKPP